MLDSARTFAVSLTLIWTCIHTVWWVLTISAAYDLYFPCTPRTYQCTPLGRADSRSIPNSSQCHLRTLLHATCTNQDTKVQRGQTGELPVGVNKAFAGIRHIGSFKIQVRALMTTDLKHSSCSSWRGRACSPIYRSFKYTNLIDSLPV